MRQAANCICILLATGAWLGAATDRLDRTRAAMAELEMLCDRADARGEPSLHHRVPLVVGRRALAAAAGLDAVRRARVLDHVYERCLRTKLALLETADGRRRKLFVPPAPPLAHVAIEGARCRARGHVVFPVALAQPPPDDVAAFFAPGTLARPLPALAGATPDTLEASEVLRVHQREPLSHRVGWDRPAGGFVRDGGPGRPAVVICIDHPAIREAIARETDKALDALPAEGRPLYASLGDGWFYADYSERSARRFVAWLQEHHKTARVVNAVWDADYAAFGPTMMPTPEQAGASLARWRDWVAFGQWRFADHVAWAIANVRRRAPRLRLGLSALRYGFAGSYGLSGVDPAAVARMVDVVEVAGGSAMQADLAAALAGGKRPVVDAAVSPGPFGILPHLLHGAAAVGLAAWPRQPLTSPPAVREAERALREALAARRLAPVVEALAEAPRPVVLLYSQSSLRLAPTWALRAARTPYTTTVAQACDAARGLHVGCRFATSDDVAAGALSGARMVVVPGARFERDDVARKLIDYVETGGLLVVLPESLLADDYGREADYLLRLGIQPLRTGRPTYTTRPRPDRGGALDEVVPTKVAAADIVPRADGPLAALRRRLRGVGLWQKIKVNVVHDVLATYGDGDPAIVAFRRGKGRVAYIAMTMDPADLAAVLDTLLAQAGVRPLVRPVGAGDAPARGLECRSVRRGDRLWAYAWNTTAESRWVAFRTPAAQAAWNLSTGEPLTVRHTAEAALVGKLELEPFATALVEIQLPPPPAP